MSARSRARSARPGPVGPAEHHGDEDADRKEDDEVDGVGQAVHRRERPSRLDHEIVQHQQRMATASNPATRRPTAAATTSSHVDKRRKLVDDAADTSFVTSNRRYQRGQESTSNRRPPR
jgi:hypothetical protein